MADKALRTEQVSRARGDLSHVRNGDTKGNKRPERIRHWKKEGRGRRRSRGILIYVIVRENQNSGILTPRVWGCVYLQAHDGRHRSPSRFTGLWGRRGGRGFAQGCSTDGPPPAPRSPGARGRGRPACVLSRDPRPPARPGEGARDPRKERLQRHLPPSLLTSDSVYPRLRPPLSLKGARWPVKSSLINSTCDLSGTPRTDEAPVGVRLRVRVRVGGVWTRGRQGLSGEAGALSPPGDRPGAAGAPASGAPGRAPRAPSSARLRGRGPSAGLTAVPDNRGSSRVAQSAALPPEGRDGAFPTPLVNNELPSELSSPSPRVAYF